MRRRARLGGVCVADPHRCGPRVDVAPAVGVADEQGVRLGLALFLEVMLDLWEEMELGGGPVVVGDLVAALVHSKMQCRSVADYVGEVVAHMLIP